MQFCTISYSDRSMLDHSTTQLGTIQWRHSNLSFTSHFLPAAICVLFPLFNSHRYCFHRLTFNAPYHAVCYSHSFHYVSLFCTQPHVTLDTAALCTDPVMCQSSVRTTNVALWKPTLYNYINNYR